jgi:CheY-like chemotaxis protein
MLTASTAIPAGPHAVSDPDLMAEVGIALLDRTREVARTIGTRVRRAIAPPSPLRVLCVDDHPDAADSSAAVLGFHGHDARACYDGPSALRACAEFAPHACVLDLGMPGMDGLDLAARLRAEVGRGPLLLIAATAWGTPEERARTALAGFHYHFVKPVDWTALLDALERFGRSIV